MRIARGRSAIGIIAVAASLALAGCITTGTTPVSPTAAEGATIIFESIDGPPRAVSARLAKNLDQEAAARRLVVVTRGGQALYHIRAYVAAHTEGGATSLAWAFDVYDAERKRAFRLRGEERAPGSSWTAANDAALQRIAAAGVAQLMTFIASDRTPGATAAAPPPQGTALAGMADDFRPEASGIFRMFTAAPAPAAEAEAAPVPLPPRRPEPGQRTSPPVLAYSVSTE
jgi:hypothetical protein